MDLRSRRRTLNKPIPDSSAGLTPGELAIALAEIESELVGMKVRDVAWLANCDDLLVFLQNQHSSRALHLTPGAARGRICCTTRRWPKQALRSGPQIDLLKQLLAATTLSGTTQAPGERRCQLLFQNAERSVKIEVELFGNRGFWALTDAAGKMRVLSRLLKRGGKQAQTGSLYDPPRPQSGARAEPAPRFQTPILDTIDAFFTRMDLDREANLAVDRLALAVTRGLKKAHAQLEGLTRQRQGMLAHEELRRDADLLLAYGFSAAKSATEIIVEDPSEPSKHLTIALQPGKSIQAQAEQLYKRARKNKDGLPRCRARITTIAGMIERLAVIDKSLAESDDLDLESIEAELVSYGFLQPSKQPKPRDPKLEKITKGENFRQAISSEGYQILIGRNNRQNDRLSKSVARGNDLWFHVGRGQAGSHVVLKLPRGKTASLESLLDAATLTIHFSKARGTHIGEVIYTQAKHVTKPKGLAPGKVIADHTKSLRVDLEPERLKRLLDSSSQDRCQQ